VDRLRALAAAGEGPSAAWQALLREFPGAPISRSAVIGKLNRLGLLGRVAPSPARRLARPPKRAPERPWTRPRPPLEPHPRIFRLVGGLDIAASDGGRPHSAIGPTECAWPLAGAGADMRCCADPIVPDERAPYCAAHLRLAFLPGTAPSLAVLERIGRAIAAMADLAGRRPAPLRLEAEGLSDLVALLQRRSA